MRTTLNIDDQLFDQIMATTTARTKTEAVNLALKEYVRLKRKEQLLALSGKIRIESNWRELRELEKHEH